MHIRLSSPIATLALVALSFSCGSDNTSDTGSGGAGGNGGTSGGTGAAGGSTGSGGTTSTGGASGSGGTTSTGGASGSGGTGTGGASGKGGASGSGGAGGKGGASGSAGASGSGGTAGNAGKGGSAGTAGIDGGSAGSAGSSGAAGSGGADAGSADSGGTGGAAGSGVTDGGPVGDAGPSAGCGKAPPAQVSTRQTIDVGGTMREYIVNYPTPYDPNRPYRVLFIHHGRGGNAEQNITRNGGWYGVGPLSGGSTIFVSPQGLAETGGETGWPNTGGRDVAFIRALVPHINSTFCVDTKRIFTTGMSYGGNFSNTLGCQMGDVFRAIVPFAGWGPQGSATCVGKIAALNTHGTADTTIDIAQGQASRAHWLAANHCTMTTAPYDPSPCVVYQGCDVGYPVGWCEHTGGHILPTFSGPAIWNFISQF